jgi:hypothetical protein
MKNKKYNFIVRPMIYPFDIMVSIGEDMDKLRDRLVANGNTVEDIGSSLDLGNTVRGRYIMLPSNQSVIILKWLPRKSDLLSTIAHESFHATHSIMDKIGMDLSYNNDEAFAYLLGYIVGEISNKLKL